MDFFQALVLGIVQGLTEWLPVSSSGHLVIAQRLMGLELPVAFDVLLHLGTLLAVIVFFRSDIAAILKSLLRPGMKNPDFRMAVMVVAGSIPTALIGFVFLGFFESLFLSTEAVGIGLIITGALLLLTRLSRLFRYGPGKPGSDKEHEEPDFKRAGLIGVFQGIAIAPGISRSGSTISAALMSGMKKEAAFKYSFLLSIPAVLGASLLELRGAATGDMGGGIGFAALAGAAVAAVCGYAGLKIVKKSLLSERFYLFSVYCFALGAALLLFM